MSLSASPAAQAFFSVRKVEFLKLFCEILEHQIENIDLLCYNVD